MSNHETNGAGGSEHHDQPAGQTAGEPAEAKDAQEATVMGSAGESATAATVPAAIDDRPLASRARARTVVAGATLKREDAGAIDPVVVADSPAEDGRSITGAERVEIARGGADNVQARSVNVDRGGIGVAWAGTVDLQRGGIGRLVATEVSVTQGGVGVARAERLSVRQGGIGAAMTGQLDLRQGVARSVLAREAHLDRAFAQTIVANQVTMGRGSGALLIVARRIEGEVRTLLDWRGALAFGAALGLVMGLVRRSPSGRRRAP